MIGEPLGVPATKAPIVCGICHGQDDVVEELVPWENGRYRRRCRPCRDRDAEESLALAEDVRALEEGFQLDSDHVETCPDCSEYRARHGGTYFAVARRCLRRI